jgi:hypothetical protein
VVIGAQGPGRLRVVVVQMHRSEAKGGGWRTTGAICPLAGSSMLQAWKHGKWSCTHVPSNYVAYQIQDHQPLGPDGLAHPAKPELGQACLPLSP